MFNLNLLSHITDNIEDVSFRSFVAQARISIATSVISIGTKSYVIPMKLESVLSQSITKLCHVGSFPKIKIFSKKY